MSIFAKLFGKTANQSHSSNQASGRFHKQGRRDSVYAPISLMDHVGRIEVSE